MSIVSFRNDLSVEGLVNFIWNKTQETSGTIARNEFQWRVFLWRVLLRGAMPPNSTPYAHETILERKLNHL